MKNHVKELTEGMQRLCAVANRIVAQQDKPSRIEVDLLLDDLRNLYDIALLLGDEAAPEEPRPMPAEAPVKEEVHEAPVKEEEHMMAMMSTMAALAPEPVEESLDKEPEPPAVAAPELPAMEELEQNDNALLFDEVIVEPVASDQWPVASEQSPVASEPEPEPETLSFDEPAKEPQPANAGQASLLDYLNQSPQRTLGESLAEGRPQANSLEKKVDDLRTVININDKFSFMSELFHNNMKAYNDFIMHLNATTSRDEALAHMRDIAAQQKWDEASPTVQAFYKVFDKKF